MCILYNHVCNPSFTLQHTIAFFVPGALCRFRWRWRNGAAFGAASSGCERTAAWLVTAGCLGVLQGGGSLFKMSAIVSALLYPCGPMCFKYILRYVNICIYIYTHIYLST